MRSEEAGGWVGRRGGAQGRGARRLTRRNQAGKERCCSYGGSVPLDPPPLPAPRKHATSPTPPPPPEQGPGPRALHPPSTTTQHPPVHNDGALVGAVVSDVLQVEADGQLEVELHRGALKLAAQRVVHGDVNLGACGGGWGWGWLRVGVQGGRVGVGVGVGTGRGGEGRHG